MLKLMAKKTEKEIDNLLKKGKIIKKIDYKGVIIRFLKMDDKFLGEFKLNGKIFVNFDKDFKKLLLGAKKTINSEFYLLKKEMRDVIIF
jgi:hypothetical protein